MHRTRGTGYLLEGEHRAGQVDVMVISKVSERSGVKSATVLNTTTQAVVAAHLHVWQAPMRTPRGS